MLLRFSCLLFSCSLLQAAVVPNRFIVELSTEPVATHVASNSGARANLQSTEAVSHRSRILREQAQARTSLEQSGARVLDQVDTVANALLVQASDSNPQPWANLAGVLRVIPVQTASLLLDRAVVVNKIADAWAQIGGPANAGQGIKIAIIDTGVDVTHPGFQNSPLTLPANFPLVNAASDTVFTNNKVIVARSYVPLFGTADPDQSARDHVGHGTALAMIAAGGTVVAPSATLTGISPAAWIGSYKVFGSPGVDAPGDVILKALDDAVKDGMDVVNLSLGFSGGTPRLGLDIYADAVERATQAGVIVVVAAGNSGSNASTVSSPASAPDSIAVGAQSNDRTFSASVQVSGLGSLLSKPGSGLTPTSPVSGIIVDAAQISGNELACNAFPAGSLSNRIALILRGTCTFATKLTNAAAAGAVAAVVYAAPSAPDAISMDVGTATLPAEMISNADGVSLKNGIASGTASLGSLVFTLSAVSIDAARLTDFSSIGPNVDLSIKPDLLAVGQDYYTATQHYDVKGEMYSADGYVLVDGTSFSAPTVSGAAALLKAARPGLTAAQYRSLLINSATSFTGSATPVSVQQAGAGSLNSGASLLAMAVASPTSLGFGAGNAFPQRTINLQVANLGTADTFAINVVPTGNSPVPALSLSSLQLDQKASGTVAVTFSGSNLAPGGYEGFVVISGANGKADTRVPYWYGVTSTTPVQITDLDSDTTGAKNTVRRGAIAFHITDAAGVPITSIVPTVSVIAGGGTVQSIDSDDADSPGLFYVTVRLGKTAGTNTFRVQAATLTADFNIVGQ